MPKKKPLITENEYIKLQFSMLKKSIDEIKSILLGSRGDSGMVHRVLKIEAEQTRSRTERTKILAECKVRVTKIYRTIALTFLIGSFIWIKESRDALIGVFLRIGGF